MNEPNEFAYIKIKDLEAAIEAGGIDGWEKGFAQGLAQGLARASEQHLNGGDTNGNQ